MPVAQTVKLDPAQVPVLTKRLIELFRKHAGNLNRVAEALGISESALKRRMAALAQLGINVRELSGVPPAPPRIAKHGKWVGYRAKLRERAAAREAQGASSEPRKRVSGKRTRGPKKALTGGP